MTYEPIVLVIEDEPPIRRFLRAALPSHGYQLVEAATGEDGLLQAAMQRPDVIILDLGLPDLDDVEVIELRPDVPRLAMEYLGLADDRRDFDAELLGFDHPDGQQAAEQHVVGRPFDGEREVDEHVALGEVTGHAGPDELLAHLDSIAPA